MSYKYKCPGIWTTGVYEVIRRITLALLVSGRPVAEVDVETGACKAASSGRWPSLFRILSGRIPRSSFIPLRNLKVKGSKMEVIDFDYSRTSLNM